MADDKGLDLTSVFGDVIKQVTEADHDSEKVDNKIFHR